MRVGPQIAAFGAVVTSACSAHVWLDHPAAPDPQRDVPPAITRSVSPLALARGADAARVNATCEACHHVAASEWRGSLHQMAATVTPFTSAFAREPSPFCRSCHAPEADPQEEPPADVAALGVACVTCHLDGALDGLGPEDVVVLAAPGVLGTTGATPGTRRLPAPHAIERTERLASPAVCAPCHEFRFPGATRDDDGAFMQTTVREHARSPEAARSCADCHMRAGADDRRSHAFPGSRDAAWVRSAIEVVARSTGPTSARITLTPRQIGHAFPTGDIFRRVEVVLEAEGPDHRTVARAERVLARHFQQRPAPLGRALVRDDRVEGAPLHVDLDVGPAGAGLPLVYRVAYQRVAHPLDEEGRQVELDGEIVLAEGQLSSASSEPASDRK